MDGTNLYEIERSLWTNDPSIYSHSLRDDARFRELNARFGL